ncbi:UNVERIFIED_CONTAM: hypothetical protein FKN15_030712 [Acipenser sinensis]
MISLVRVTNGIGPVLGLLFIPLIGSASDHCTSSYSRRLPFIWLLSLGVLLALFIIPHADMFAFYFSWGGWAMHVAFLILGVGLLDFCGQVCFTPLEALLSDLYREEEDCGQAFAMFSFMVSLGGCIGYLLPAVNWTVSYLSAYLGDQEECLFSLLTFILSVLVTMKVSQEPTYPSGRLLLEWLHRLSASSRQLDRQLPLRLPRRSRGVPLLLAHLHPKCPCHHESLTGAHLPLRAPAAGTKAFRECQIYMPKTKAKNMLKNGITITRESVYLTPNEQCTINHNHKQNGHVYFEPEHAGSGGDGEEEDFGKRGIGLDFAIQPQ